MKETGLLTSPIGHTPYRRTQPPPPGDRQREDRKGKQGAGARGGRGGGGREQKTQRQGDKTQKGKTGVRYRKERNMHVSREEARVCLFSGPTDRQLNSGGVRGGTFLTV